MSHSAQDVIIRFKDDDKVRAVIKKARKLANVSVICGYLMARWSRTATLYQVIPLSQKRLLTCFPSSQPPPRSR